MSNASARLGRPSWEIEASRGRVSGETLQTYNKLTVEQALSLVPGNVAPLVAVRPGPCQILSAAHLARRTVDGMS